MGLRSILLACLSLIPIGGHWGCRAVADTGRVPSRLVVVDDRAYPPLSFLDPQGNPRGINIDIWNLWSRTTGIPVEFHLMDWEGALEAVQAGRADVIGGLCRTSERDRLFDFAAVLLEVPSSIFFHEGISGLKGYEDLAGFRVGVVAGDSAEDLLRSNYPQIQPVVYPDMGELVRAAVSGEVQVFLGDVPTVRYYLGQTSGGEKFRQAVGGQVLSKEYAAVRKGDVKARQIVQSGFDRISSSEIDAIVEEWAGRAVVRGLPWRKVGWGLFGGFLLTGAILLWNLELRRLVARATRAVEEQNRHLALSHEALRRGEARWKQLFALAPIPLACASKDGITLSKSFSQILGYTSDDIVSVDDWWNRAYPDPEYRHR